MKSVRTTDLDHAKTFRKYKEYADEFFHHWLAPIESHHRSPVPHPPVSPLLGHPVPTVSELGPLGTPGNLPSLRCWVCATPGALV